MITVLRAGPLTTVQDRGRPGFAHLGVPRAGALDQAALRRANDLVGNDPSAAGLETTLMGCRLRAESAIRIALTGATCTLKIDGIEADPVGPIEVAAGSVIDIGRATAGVRSYLAVAGGIAVEPVLGSRSTDTLSGLGPPRLTDGQALPIGALPIESGPTGSLPIGVGPTGIGPRGTGPTGAGSGPTGTGPTGAGPIGSGRIGSGPAVRGGVGDSDGAGRTRWSGDDQERAAGESATSAAADLILGVWIGPRADWVEVAGLFGDAYRVSPVSNRVACRLAGTGLTRRKAGELAPEGMVLGAIQVPPDGQPLIFLADHPTTGGYPVVGVVDDVTPLAQARPGTSVRFRELD